MNNRVSAIALATLVAGCNAAARADALPDRQITPGSVNAAISEQQYRAQCHAKGWTRAQAIQFFVDNTSKPRHDIEVEVDRYIAWPGQALAYKLGELKIKELRGYATKELGERLSIRDFHDAVLGAGALPLDVLDARVRRWVAAEKAKKAN